MDRKREEFDALVGAVRALQGKAIKRDPKDPDFSFSWRTDVDGKLTADEVIETPEDKKGGRLSKAETAQRALLYALTDAGLNGLDSVAVEHVKAAQAAALGEEKISKATYQRSYEGDSRSGRGKPPALPDGLRPIELNPGRWGWPTLKPWEPGSE